MSHRIPLKPASMKAKPVLGMCRWCDLGILDGRGMRSRKTWHPACVNEFKLIFWPAVTRRAVFERDRGMCVKCSTQCNRLYSRDWQHDHIVCLKLADPNDLSFWRLGNIQTLCTACHQLKTKEDMRAIRAAKVR